MKRIFVILLAFIGFASNAKAYDEDTHFYATYAMARYVGIRHEVATQIALSTQWMDESYMSDPTSMIFMPITGIRKRRLLHFPSSRVVGMAANVTEVSTIGGIPLEIEKIASDLAKKMGITNRINDLQFQTETVEDHAFASELLMQGMKNGNLMMAGAGLHTMEDSFAHAGTTAEQGHAFIWHWPDRPFASPEKYMRMSQTVIGALVAIRTLLPADAIDCSLKLAPIPSPTPNCQLDAQTLGDNYASTTAIRNVISYDVLKDPAFVRTAIADLLSRATKVGYIKKTQAQLVALIRSMPIDGRHDTESITELILTRLLGEELSSKSGSVNIRLILSDMGRLPSDASPELMRNYVTSFGSENLFKSLAGDLLRWRVPSPLDDSHRVELEDDTSAIRKKEMDLRLANIQALIKNLYGVQLQMISNPTKDDAGFDREVLMDRTAETIIKVDPKVTYVTFSLSDRNKFDKMIFQFLFPSFTGQDLVSIVQQTAAVKKQLANFSAIKADYDKYLLEKQSGETEKKSSSVIFSQAGRYASNIAAFLSTMKTIAELTKPMLPLMLKDTVGTHLVPQADNFYYRDATLFSGYRQRGVVKQFLGPSDVWFMGLLKEKARMQAGRPPENL